jgi:hypothetical protein
MFDLDSTPRLAPLTSPNDFRQRLKPSAAEVSRAPLIRTVVLLALLVGCTGSIASADATAVGGGAASDGTTVSDGEAGDGGPFDASGDSTEVTLCSEDRKARLTVSGTSKPPTGTEKRHAYHVTGTAKDSGGNAAKPLRAFVSLHYRAVVGPSNDRGVPTILNMLPKEQVEHPCETYFNEKGELGGVCLWVIEAQVALAKTKNEVEFQIELRAEFQCAEKYWVTAYSGWTPITPPKP